MNIFDYLFEHTFNLEKELILGPREKRTFKSIVGESLKLANYLRREIGQEQKVLLIAPNSAFSIVAYLAILKSGNVCVPLSPGIEQEGFEFIKDKTQSKIGFYSESVSTRLNPSDSSITEKLQIDIIEKENGPITFGQEFDGDRLAEIIFTSGSTALPKGVMLSHNNIRANTGSIVQYLNLTENDIMMVVLPFFYCYGLSLLHTHIRVGGSLVLNNNFMFLGSTVKDLNKYQCTGFAGVPSHFQILLRKSDLFKSSTFPRLRYVTQAGGKLHTAFITEFTEAFPSIQFYVMYGQTEATARLSYLPPTTLKEKLGSLGKGIPGVELKVVDANGSKIEPGETGEIVAKGENVMLGYFEDAVATLATIKDGWLYTGDLATIDEDGFIYLTARKKEIIKIGGKRVSPKEIEEVIVSMAGVIDCTVESVDDELLGEAIKATVVVNKEKATSISEQDVRQYCAIKLSSYKVPSQVIFRDAIEVAPSGKKIKSVN